MLLSPHSHANLYAIVPAGVDSDPLRNGFSATSLDEDEVERLLDACIRHSDHWSGFKVAAMVLLGQAWVSEVSCFVCCCMKITMNCLRACQQLTA
jgi:hypothetical protein